MSSDFQVIDWSGFIRPVGETNVLKGYQVQISGKNAQIQNQKTENQMYCSVKRIRQFTNDDIELTKPDLQEHRTISLSKLISQLQGKRVAKK